MQTITIEDVERLATELETETEAKRERLERLCRAYVRILVAREPERFSRRATHCGDEAGHYDSSYPPRMEWSDHSGPATIRIAERTTEDIPTTGGYYYEWRRVTTYGGLAIDMHGRWWRGDETGTGQIGQFAAYPGCYNVDVSIEWDTVSSDDISTAELDSAEAKLRSLAFPLTAGGEAK